MLILSLGLKSANSHKHSMMATGKTLSKGTLGLRFMQNAQRVKQQPTPELDRAKVKDDAEWEVAKEIREAWGLASSSTTESE